MFDERLAKGVVFRLDAEAAKEHSLDDGTEYAISRDATSIEVRASKFKEGKPSKGRPRKFTVAEVARMLSIEVQASEPEVQAEAEVEDTEAADEAHVEALVSDTVEPAGDDW